MYTCFNEELIEYQQNCVKFVQELVNQKPCDNVISFGDFYRSLFEKSLIKEFKQEPENYYTRLSILTQAVSSFDPALAYALICQQIVIEFIAKYTDSTVFNRYYPNLVEGKMLATYAFHEAQAGSDLTNILSSINQNSLTGHKTLVANYNLANLYLVLTHDNTFVLVDASNEFDKVRQSPKVSLLGLDTINFGDLIFDNYPVDEANIFKFESNFNSVLNHLFDLGKVLISAISVGLMETCLSRACSFAKERQQFGKSISSFQGIQFKLADVDINLSAAKMLAYRASWALDTNDAKTRLYAAMAKSFAGLAARNYSAEAVGIMGINGIIKSNVMEKLYRDAKVLELILETTEMQKNIIADAIINDLV